MSPQRAATLAPRRLLTTPGFWRTNRGLIGAAVFGIALISLLFDLTYPRAGGATYLVILIYLIAAWGLFLAFRAAARVEVDDAIARRVQEHTTTKLGQLKGGTLRRIELDRLEALIPHNPHWNQGMIQLFRLVIEEARDRKFHTPALLTQPLRDRNIGDLFHLQTLQRTALQLGILGTFIGLIRAILKLRGSADHGLVAENLGTFSGLIRAILKLRGSISGGLVTENLDALFEDLHLSFSTSIAGLVVSVLLGLVLMALRQRLESFFGHMESALRSFITLARRSEITDEYLAEFSQIRDALGQVQDSIQGHAAEVRLQTLEIQSGLGALGKLRLRFNEFLEDIRGEQAHVLSEFKSVYELVSPRKTAEELEQSLTRSIERVSGSFDSRLKAGLAELQRYNESLETFRSVLGEMRRHAEQAIQESATSRETFEKAYELAGSRMKEMVAVHGRLLDKLEKARELDNGSLDGRLEPHLSRAHRLLEDHRRALQATNALLEKLVDRPGFFHSALVRPWRWLRLRFGK